MHTAFEPHFVLMAFVFLCAGFAAILSTTTQEPVPVIARGPIAAFLYAIVALLALISMLIMLLGLH